MKQSSEQVTDFLSYFTMMRDYLNLISKKKAYMDATDIIYFSTLLKKQLDGQEINIKKEESVKVMNGRLILTRLYRNGIIDIDEDNNIILPDNIPLELTVS